MKKVKGYYYDWQENNYYDTVNNTPVNKATYIDKGTSKVEVQAVKVNNFVNVVYFGLGTIMVSTLAVFSSICLAK